MTTQYELPDHHFHAHVDRYTLCVALRHCLKVLKPKKPPPYSQIELIPTEGGMKCRAANGVIGLQVTIPATQAAGEPSMVDGKMLLKILESHDPYRDDPEDEGDTVELTIEHERDMFDVEICDTGFESRSPIEAPKEVQHHTWYTHAAKRHAPCVPRTVAFADAMGICALFTSKDESRLNLRGIFFEHDGTRGTFVATDGHQLAVVKRPFEFSKLEPILIPREVAPLLLCGVGLGITVDEDRIYFQTTYARDLDDLDPLPVEIWATLLRAATFPKYRDVIPVDALQDGTPRIALPRAELQNAFATFKILQCSHSDPMVLSIKGERLRLETLHGGLSSDQPSGSVSVQGRGESPSSEPIGINAAYAHDALHVIDDGDVFMQWSGPLEPVVFTDRDREQIVVVMPLRI